MRDLNAVLGDAVARGIISESQRTAIEALAGERAGVDVVSPAAPRASSLMESARGFNAVSVAYIVGAMLVLVAFAWFLIERWESLGAGGVLAVSLTYTALFIAVSVTLGRLGFPTASGVAALLSVAMTPVWMWALQSLAGLWPDAAAGDALTRYAPWMAWRWLVIELATIGIALVAMRRVRFAPLIVPLAIALAWLAPTLGQALIPDELTPWLIRRTTLIGGTALLLLAFAVDRGQQGDEDWAGWLYAAALVTCTIGYVDVWSRAHAARHALAPMALLLIVASLYLRRRLVLAAGLLASFAYITWLAFDVFRKVLNLPIALATVGLIVILATVGVQRRYPALVQRVSGSGARRLDLIPGGWYAAAGPLLIAITLLVADVPEARQEGMDRAFRERVMMKRNARGNAMARKGARGVPPAGRGDESRVVR